MYSRVRSLNILVWDESKMSNGSETFTVFNYNACVCVCVVCDVCCLFKTYTVSLLWSTCTNKQHTFREMCLNYSEEENCDGRFFFCCLIVGQNTTNVFTLLGLVPEQWTVISL